MKLKSLLFVLCFGLFTNAMASNVHMHPKADKPGTKDLSYPGPCEIEIINDGYTNVRVFGAYDDGAPIDFYIYRYEAPHYINLYYYGYCHSGANLTIASPYQTLYSGWTTAGTSLRIAPYLNKEMKVQVTAK